MCRPPPGDRPVVEDAIWNRQFVYNSRDYGVKNTPFLFWRNYRENTP